VYLGLIPFSWRRYAQTMTAMQAQAPAEGAAPDGGRIVGIRSGDQPR
jgi:hypothetical protein